MNPLFSVTSSKLKDDERLTKYVDIIVQENNQLKKQVDKINGQMEKLQTELDKVDAILADGEIYQSSDKTELSSLLKSIRLTAFV